VVGVSDPTGAGGTGTTRVLLADDDPLVRTGLRLLLGGAGDIEVVGEVGDGAQVAAAVARLRPDVVLMDIRMPVLDGIAATRALTGRAGGAGGAAGAGGGGGAGRVPAVIVLTTFDADGNVLESIRAGAAGFLLKHTPPEQIVAAVRRAGVGEPVLSPTVARRLMDHVAGVDAGSGSRAAADRLARLSERERQVAVAVAEGWSNAEIADRLFMSVGTVKAHVSSALSKLDLTNRIQLALLAHDARDTRAPDPGR
jgi:DNA-binding NarL/FixJ family response regulator